MNYYNKISQAKGNGFENVSRSPSVASLPLGHPHSIQPIVDINVTPYNPVSTQLKVAYSSFTRRFLL